MGQPARHRLARGAAGGRLQPGRGQWLHEPAAAYPGGAGDRGNRADRGRPRVRSGGDGAGDGTGHRQGTGGGHRLGADPQHLAPGRDGLLHADGGKGRPGRRGGGVQSAQHGAAGGEAGRHPQQPDRGRRTRFAPASDQPGHGHQRGGRRQARRGAGQGRRDPRGVGAGRRRPPDYRPGAVRLPASRRRLQGATAWR